MKYHDVIWFIDRSNGEISVGLITCVNDQFFEFSYGRRKCRCTYDYAKDKVFLSRDELIAQSLIAPCLEDEAIFEKTFHHDDGSSLPSNEANSGDLNSDQNLPKAASPSASSPPPPVRSCDNCMLRRRNECTEIRSRLCPSYKAAYIPTEEDKEAQKNAKETNDFIMGRTRQPHQKLRGG